MSLRDTIEGARDEAKSTVDAMTKKTAAAEENAKLVATAKENRKKEKKAQTSK